METKSGRKYSVIVSLLLLLLCLGIYVEAQKKSMVNIKEKSVVKIAKGTFEVKAAPQPPEENVGDPSIGRLSLDKVFTGSLTGKSKGQMLGAKPKLRVLPVMWLSSALTERSTAKKAASLCNTSAACRAENLI
ncbi:MAG: DUF3224 domain-containing protein [Pyrinomonadaceae bacterium]